jgi:hypothetical protein
MKVKGITGKGCYKECWFTPKWFIKGMRGAGAELLNVRGIKHYIGYGFNKNKKDWDWGMFATDFELSIDSKWKEESDFIIHFGEPLFGEAL